LSTARVALVGLGGIAAEHLTKLNRQEGVEVVGICDLSPSLVEAVGERWGVGPGFTDYAEMLAGAKPDVVHVLTPPHTHRELVLDALDRGAHVFVEKPISVDLAEYEKMRDAARARGLRLVENYNYRFMDVAERALALLASGALGTPVNVDVSMGVGLGASYVDPEAPHFAHALPGGALRNFASHPASIATMVVPEWQSVSVSQRRLTPDFPSNDELRALIADSEACVTLAVTSHGRPSRFAFSVEATEGTVEVDIFSRRLHVDAASPATARITNGVRAGLGHLAATASLVRRATTSRQGYFQGFERLLDGFYGALREGREPPVTIEQMDRTNALVDALFDPENQV
jgi:predicted dehydrogenase